MDINQTMYGNISERNSKEAIAADYDSDETIIEDSIIGSDDENDQLMLKSLCLNKDTCTPTNLCHYENKLPVNLSPEIQNLTKLQHEKRERTRDVTIEEVCDSQMQEEQSQFLIRGWLHNTGSNEAGFGSQEPVEFTPLSTREELEDGQSITFSKRTSDQTQSPFNRSENGGLSNNANPILNQHKRRKAADPQSIQLTRKSSNSTEKKSNSRRSNRYKKSFNLPHSEPSFTSGKPTRKPAKTLTAKTGSLADHKRKFLQKLAFGKNQYGETSLHRAAKQNDIDLLCRILKTGADVNMADNAGWTPLHEACIFGYYNAAKCLLEAGADVNAIGFGQVAPIHDAVNEGNYEMTKLLLENGANPHLITEIGKSAFDYIEDVNLRNLLFLFDSKMPATSLYMDVTSNQSTIIATAECGDKEIAEDMANSHKQKEPDVDIGWTALHRASCKGFTDVIEELLQAGAKVNNRGLDGIRPIHSAVSGNHFEAVDLLLHHGANPWLRDDNQENAFDKCCSERMTALLKPPGSDMLALDLTGTEFSHLNTMSDHSSIEHKYSTREKRSRSIVDTLQEIENRQKKLLATNLETPQVAERYVEAMLFIQDILKEVIVLQRNERDMLAKKYRASVNSFKQGALRKKLAILASRQKKLVKMVNNQKEVAQKITEYKQSKASNANNRESSALCDSNRSPGRNRISASCAVSNGLGANCTNGRTIATKVSASSAVPDSETIQFHYSFPSPTGFPEMNSIEADSANIMESEKGPNNGSHCMAFNESFVEMDDYFLSLHSCSDITPTSLSSTINNPLDSMAPGNKTLNSICINSTLNITDTHNKVLRRVNRHQIPGGCRISGESLDSHVNNIQTTIQGKSVANRDNHQQEINRLGYPDHSLGVQQNSKQITARAEKSMRKVPIGELLKMGKIKPGQDVLEFHLQGIGHKASLLNDGRIRDGSGTIYLGPIQWVKALLGNEISVTCKYVMNKVFYNGKNLSTFITQKEDVSLKESRPIPLHEDNMVPKSLPQILKIKDILIIRKKEFLPSHVADECWKQFMEGDSWTV